LTEHLLQFIWQHQYFSRGDLVTIADERVQVIHPGTINLDQGPDFLNAKIKIDETLWVGNVELHICTSGWRLHAHENDVHYQNVILHVVWQHDSFVNTIPVLELCNSVSSVLLEKYESLSGPQKFIPCETKFSSIDGSTLESWKNPLVLRRLKRKSGQIQNLLSQSNYNWEEVLWWLLAKNFGSKVNGEVFELIARSIPFSLIKRQRNNYKCVEALLLGQAGLLQMDYIDEYPKLLKKEYLHYQGLYKLTPLKEKPKFLRMRPASFPTIRLSQLAMLICRQESFFTRILADEPLSGISTLLRVTASEYWNEHYLFDDPSLFKLKKTGNEMISGIIINTICPVIFCYGEYHELNEYRIRALRILEEIEPEKNNITQGFSLLGAELGSSLDSQALTELKHEFCESRKCLDCRIGCSILER
jgi:hypothetical protein